MIYSITRLFSKKEEYLNGKENWRKDIYFSEPQEIMKIQDIFVTGGSIFMNGNVVICGKLESDIKLGDKIRIKETGKTYNISSILIKGKKLNGAKEGDSVGLELKFATKNSVKRGMTII